MPVSDVYTMAQYMTSADLIAEIKMQRQAEGGAFLLLEGSSDYKRFKRFLDESSTSIVICWGKSRVLDVVSGTDSFVSDDCVGLVDSDFDKLLGNVTELDNLIYSDSHDFDLDWATLAALERYILEVGDSEKCKICSDWKTEIMAAIEPLSKMKFSNAAGQIQCSFKNLDWIDCFDGSNFNVEKVAFKILKKQSPGRDEIESFCATAAENTGLDLLQVTNGHDFLTALGCCLAERMGHRRKQHIEKEEVEKHIRLTFDHKDFEGLGVFKSLVDWQKATGYRVLN